MINPFGERPSDTAYVEMIRARVVSRRWSHVYDMALLALLGIGCVWLMIRFDELLDGMELPRSQVYMGLALGFAFGAAVGGVLSHSLSALFESLGWVGPARTEALLVRYYDECSPLAPRDPNQPTRSNSP